MAVVLYTNWLPANCLVYRNLVLQRECGIWFAPWFNGHWCLYDLCFLGLMKCSYELYSVAIFSNYFLNQNTQHQQWCWKIWRFERLTAIVKDCVGYIPFSYCNWPLPSSCPTYAVYALGLQTIEIPRALVYFLDACADKSASLKWTVLVCSLLGGVQILGTAKFLVLCFSKNTYCTWHCWMTTSIVSFSKTKTSIVWVVVNNSERI